MKKTIFLLLAAMALWSCKQTTTETNKSKANTLPPSTFSAKGKTAAVYTTAKDSKLRLSLTNNLRFAKATQPLETDVFISVNPDKVFQTFIGIGGAITDASAEVFAKLPQEKQQEFLNAYYGKDGIDYSLLRTTIHSCDFSSASYTYVKEGDTDLESFSIEPDRKLRIPLIKQAMEHASEPLLCYASPWSPPAFMKSNNNMLQGGKLLPAYYDAWANYFVKFINAYEAEGIPIWGVTIQNEPMAKQRWESCIYTAQEEANFLKNHLGPAFHKNGLSDKNIVVWDHNRDLISHRANTIFDDPEAAKYAWGIGFHWYETWTGSTPNFNNLKKIKEAYPGKNLLFTEGCNEGFDRTKYQYWPNAERYGHSIINDFNSGTAGWTDWNILLDHTGGPNHVGNFCFAPIHGNTQTGELIYTPSYYYIGHFSKYIRPGAQRVSTSSSRNQLESTSFLNKTGEMVTVVMNATDKNIAYKLLVDKHETRLEIPARAIQTLVY